MASATVYLGENITSSATLRQVFKRFFPMLGSHLIWRLFLVFTLISISFSIILTIRQGASGILLGLIGFPIACYFLVCWVFHLPIVLLEEPRVGYALKRSSELVRGTWWQVVGILILILLTSYAIAVIFKVSLGFIFIFTKFAGNTDLRSIIEWSIMEKVLDTSNFFFYVIMTCADLILKALVLPIWVIGVTILYFDRRIRKEGSDIELTASTSEDV
ncbi:MAG: glycerophosphoryl diester phosphodiesterase membrane domain-containing protein [Candidatus Poribacteria bacterium]|nr:glycerophosphoryl diester phosphodiesterase membrane domain-containing protein [Candidatus Poribacteria bacterium]